MFLLVFVFVITCCIVLFKELRKYADAYYTACLSASFALLSALFYLFGDIIVAEEGVLGALRLLCVICSLSLAFSLFLIERDKRRAALD
jgi:hypothetical protein